VQGVILVLAGFLWPLAWGVLGLEMLLYLILLCIAAMHGVQRVKTPSALVVVPFLVALHHFWYALGVLHAPLTGYRKLFLHHQGDISDPFGTRVKKG